MQGYLKVYALIPVQEVNLAFRDEEFDITKCFLAENLKYQ